MGLADGEDQRLPCRTVVIIRDEQARDYDVIQRLLTEAFGGGAEAKLVEGLRCDGELAHALVAEDAGVAGGRPVCIDEEALVSLKVEPLVP